jgi:hypothetical protein
MAARTFHAGAGAIIGHTLELDPAERAFGGEWHYNIL